jgi:hypothetical protein
MFRSQAAFDDAILAQLEVRLAAVRAKSFDQLRLLPEWLSEDATVLGKRVTFTVYRQDQPDGSLLVLVRSDKPIFFGIGVAGTTEGFFVGPDGEKREACGDEIADFFG